MSHVQFLRAGNKFKYFVDELITGVFSFRSLVAYPARVSHCAVIAGVIVPKSKYSFRLCSGKSNLSTSYKERQDVWQENPPPGRVITGDYHTRRGVSL